MTGSLKIKPRWRSSRGRDTPSEAHRARSRLKRMSRYCSELKSWNCFGKSFLGRTNFSAASARACFCTSPAEKGTVLEASDAWGAALRRWPSGNSMAAVRVLRAFRQSRRRTRDTLLYRAESRRPTNRFLLSQIHLVCIRVVDRTHQRSHQTCVLRWEGLYKNLPSHG